MQEARGRLEGDVCAFSRIIHYGGKGGSGTQPEDNTLVLSYYSIIGNTSQKSIAACLICFYGLMLGKYGLALI